MATSARDNRCNRQLSYYLVAIECVVNKDLTCISQVRAARSQPKVALRVTFGLKKAMRLTQGSAKAI